jgi:hypothetical protein
MKRQRIIIESPLSGDFLNNRRYATWCCREMHEAGYSPLASHLVAPWFMDDRDAEDRAAGIDMPWFWLPDVPHIFFIDFGISLGMVSALQRCRVLGIPTMENFNLSARYLRGFLDGKWPPHTPGFGPEQAETDDDFRGLERLGPLRGLPPGWCDPENGNYDPVMFEQALTEQEAYDESLSSSDETQKTAELLESAGEVLKLPPRSGPPESR